MSFFFRNSIGFFVQLFPALMLGCTAFRIKDWRGGRRKYILRLTVLTVFFSL